ncbi:MAG: 3-isopropylmalate dehydrogenase [Bifidobacteriaceae bacterium]|jgi:3-isopropylmalate dehydrogenase|nr:3-isopropylmalate dehydrogenase [Bifidobacteriaceae bacterium]
MKNIKLAVIPGDGIGKEVTPIALDILEKAASIVAEDSSASEDQKVSFTNEFFNLGAETWHKTGETLNADTIAKIKLNDAILLGAVGDPSVPSGVLERGLLLKLRFELDHYINLRPSKIFKGFEDASPLKTHGDFDFVVVREGTEGPYAGNGGTIRTNTDEEIASELSVNTAYGVKRTVEYAFKLASSRPRKKITLVHKHNVLVNAGNLWKRYFEAEALKYPDIEIGYLHVDATTMAMVNNPSQFDVIVTDNLFGDIITDLAGAVSGGIGLAASGNIDASGKNPSMFEPVHGSAPDIAGENKADPTAAISSAAMLASHLGLDIIADKINAAINKDLENRYSKGTRGTTQIGEDIKSLL